MTNSEITIIVLVLLLVVVFIPWYTKQLGRFFIQGIIEFYKEILEKLGDPNGKKEKKRE